MNNHLKNIRIEFHILQSFPVTCLNRDDVGAPKSAIVGGVPRARVSSQCWKRAVRMALPEFGVTLGIRTKEIEELIQAACITNGADEKAASECANAIASQLTNNTLFFIGVDEVAAYAQYAAEVDFDADKIKAKKTAELIPVSRKSRYGAANGLDIALFGRMVAAPKVQSMSIEAAASFSHAISTHLVNSELDYFTALDDVSQISAHLDLNEFNSATYYRYISLDLGQLAQTFTRPNDKLDVDDIKKAIAAFTKALFVAVPVARQATQSGASPWDYAKVYVRRGQRIQMSFEQPIKHARDGGYLAPSRAAVKEFCASMEKKSGSLFGKMGDYEWGENSEYSIDNLIDDLNSHVG